MALEKTPLCNFGEKTKDFNLKGIDENKYSLKSILGEAGTLIMFICNHCPYVKAISKEIAETATKLLEYKIKVVAIMSNDTLNYPEDSFENMKLFAKKNNFTFPYLIDETQEVAKKYGAMCTPDPFLFNSQKELVFHGRIDNAMKPDDVATEKTMILNMKKLIAGEKIEKDFDPSIGCSIKWKED